MSTEVADFLARFSITPEARQEQLDQIRQKMLDLMAVVRDGPNFRYLSRLHLGVLFDEYDVRFFEGILGDLLGPEEPELRVSGRMTRTGGKVSWRADPAGGTPSFCITISSLLLRESFRDESCRTIRVNGLVCHDRLDALQRIFEHELIHLTEVLTWGNSSCSQSRFQKLAFDFFGHTEYRHGLVTPRERAYRELGIRAGSRVSFVYEGVTYEGIVNRITKRATVLVESQTGERYSDGKRYSKFYVPLTMLKPLEDDAKRAQTG